MYLGFAVKSTHDKDRSQSYGTAKIYYNISLFDPALLC